MKFLKPGPTENQVIAHIMVYSIPRMEDVIVSSGPNTWPCESMTLGRCMVLAPVDECWRVAGWPRSFDGTIDPLLPVDNRHDPSPQPSTETGQLH